MLGGTPTVNRTLRTEVHTQTIFGNVHSSGSSNPDRKGVVQYAAGHERITRRTTTLRHLKRIMVVAQWFLVQVGNLTLSYGYCS